MEPEILTDDDLVSSMVEYQTYDRPLSAFLCRPKQAEESPGIVLLQEWWGLNDHIKEIAQRLGKENFVVLAPDLYSRLGSVVTKNAAEAAKLAKALSEEQTLADLLIAVRYLKELPQVNSRKIGIAGFSIGGSYALLLACRTNEVRCAVSFYGEIPGDTDIQKLQAPILYFHGDADGWIKKEDVERLRESIKRDKKIRQVAVYPGAPHAFFNDTRREVYNPEAAKDAWKKTVEFFEKYLK